MAKIVLVSCVSKKRAEAAQAQDLYLGPLFINSLAYAKKLKPDHIFILSAKYGLLQLNDWIEPYNVTLSYISPAKRAAGLEVLTSAQTTDWGKAVITSLKLHCNLLTDEIIVLAGKSYLQPIQHEIKHLQEPLKGLRQGERVAALKRLIKQVPI